MDPPNPPQPPGPSPIMPSPEVQAQMQALFQEQRAQRLQQEQEAQQRQSTSTSTTPSSPSPGPQPTQPHVQYPLNISTLLPTSITSSFTPFPTRRSVTYTTTALASSTQPPATLAGLSILRLGGNAADAAVAIAAALAVTEPMSTGPGGDLFALFYTAATGCVSSLNGTGRSGCKQTYPVIRSSLGLPPAPGPGEKPGRSIPTDSVHAVTVPGAAAGWVDALTLHGSGKVTLAQVLEPAIKLAENGWSVPEVTAHSWKGKEEFLINSPNGTELLLYDKQEGRHRAPRAGEIMRNPNLAHTFRLLGEGGKEAFYDPAEGTNTIPTSILKILSTAGSLLEESDLQHHLEKSGGPTDTPPAIFYDFRGQGLSPSQGTNLVVWEHAPNSQGLIALIALGLFEEFETAGKIPKFTPEDFLGIKYVHAVIEALRIAFKEGGKYVGDMSERTQLHNPHAAQRILDRRPPPDSDPSSPNPGDGGGGGGGGSTLLQRWSRQFSPTRALPRPYPGADTVAGSNTVYFAVTDTDGNAVSFVNSNFAEFGSGIVPEGTGFVLHNRGGGFRLDPRHGNCVFPRRRPYHTLIPGMVTYGGGVNKNNSGGGGGGGGGSGTGSGAGTTSGAGGGSSGGGGRGAGQLHSLFGVKGGYVQPQGHLQVLLAQIIAGCNPQQALDAPRICVGPGMPDPALKGTDGLNDQGGFGGDWRVFVEEGMPESTITGLRELGHDVVVLEGWDRHLFGKGQIIRQVRDGGTGERVWMGGSDGRGDGQAIPL